MSLIKELIKESDDSQTHEDIVIQPKIKITLVCFNCLVKGNLKRGIGRLMTFPELKELF